MARLKCPCLWKVVLYLHISSAFSADHPFTSTVDENNANRSAAFSAETNVTAKDSGRPDNFTAANKVNGTYNEPTRRYEKRFPLRASIKHFTVLYLVPIILLTGTCGNILSLIIYSQPTFCKSATSFLFRVLAVADTVALNYGLWNNLIRDVFGMDILQQTTWQCKLNIYLKYLLADFPVWVLVLISLERAVGVAVPHRARLIITKLRLAASMVFIFLFLAAYNVPMIISATSGNVTKNMTAVLNKCTYSREHITLVFYVVPWMDLTMYALLPLGIMSVCSSVIIIIMVRRKRNTVVKRSRNVDANALTATLLIVCLVFMLLTLPHAIFSISALLLHSHRRTIDVQTWHLLAGVLRYVNNAINFFLYCLSGQPFRTELWRLFCRLPTMRQQEPSTSSARISMISKSNCSH